jgi:hypothetical protein
MLFFHAVLQHSTFHHHQNLFIAPLHILFSFHYSQHNTPIPQRYHYFVVVVRLEWSDNPESHASSSIATGRAPHAGQVKVMTQTKRDTQVRDEDDLTSVKKILLLRSLTKDAGWIIVVKRPRNYKNEDSYITTWKCMQSA